MKTRRAQQIFHADDRQRMTALQRTDTALQRTVLTKRSIGLARFLESQTKTMY
jgi:hypothetical protein